MLELETFQTVIQSTPLVSIDFIVRNTSGQILLGKRNNRPAKGYWFVPGGRILKDEVFNVAFARLVNQELGLEINSAQFKGIYQHFYDDNFSAEDFTTHYVVLAYELDVEQELLALPEEQHCEYQWVAEKELLLNPDVHEHSKWYFLDWKQADAKFI
ncbi:GDP-mannose mannosyl hydrolase [Agarivorans albus]|uniref:GDP-mannose mannosyl hydrolase n=1 Tax=Agarivorans albus MKT 106 TaxID=1331007 RepID=R9PN13_AGAAL|nr:GDP-mannose mannosyl hydrolase [Agarivorans albus]GAD02767.1 GDP-mannose mannosyl hydrolase [Agarivorans albus MKT 106]